MSSSGGAHVRGQPTGDAVVIGIDVGSTTV
jgi:hypothetical protein